MDDVALGRLMNRNAVLFAVYALADRQGLLCSATNRKIAEASGRSLGIVGYTLLKLEREGIIRSLGRCHGLRRRVIVLMDHREAGRLVWRLSGTAPSR
ncbi:hypothetical protein ACYOEI_09940 [Singulisphaera rosea]